MQDLRPNNVFKASAFMPSDEEVRAACRAATSRARSPPKKKTKIEVIDLDSSDSDSDSDMPDFAALMRSSPKDKKDTKAKSKKPVKGKGKTRKMESDEDDSESESGSESSESDAPRKRSRAKPKATARGKAKATPKKDDRDSSEAPPQADPRQFDMWKQGGSNVESSAKMLQMIAYLKEWESTGDKTIVFSQCGWPFVSCCACVGSDVCGVGTSMLDLCEQVFARHGIRSLRYDGSMNREAREYCLMEFRRPTGPKVVLVRYVVCTSISHCLTPMSSIKCGGVGLNLVSANRVIK